MSGRSGQHSQRLRLLFQVRRSGKPLPLGVKILQCDGLLGSWRSDEGRWFGAEDPRWAVLGQGDESSTNGK